jgi:hypothetical protein
MKMKMRDKLYLPLIVCLGFVGCSEGPIKTVPVYGKVSFVGRNPPERTDLIFTPITSAGPLRPSFAELEPDGSYQMKAFERSKGLIPGKYQITVTLHDAKPGGNLKLESGWKNTDVDAGEVEVPADSKGIEHNIEVPAKQSAAKKNT